MKVPVPDVLLPADQLGRVHFVGIGGAGLSGIARIMLARGISVSGSDAKDSAALESLRALGARCHVGHAAEQVREVDTLVVSTAVREDNPEVVEARAQGLNLLPRSAALDSLMQGRTVVAVAGTHGKTTTTSMTAHVLKSLGENPTALVGGELNDIGSNVAFGRTDLVVAEADESDRSLLYLRPQVAVVTNVEFDHPDFYSSLEDVVETFSAFLAALPPDGHLVTCADDPICLQLASEAPCPSTTYGISGGDLRAEVLGPQSYRLFENGEERGTVELGVYGRHNVL